jgi:NAD(P)-dependent dehydrogenase (short-subunit alcohol dehydrogenase family)
MASSMSRSARSSPRAIPRCSTWAVPARRTVISRIAATQQALPHARVLNNDADDPDDAQALAQAVVQFGGLGGLWLNAGYGAVAGVDEVDAEFFDQMMNTNVRGPVLQLAHLAEHLNQGASVVLTSSTATYEGSPMASVYAATKAALVALTRNWATALANRGIRVNVVVPGAIGTNFRGFMSEQVRESFETDVVGRVPLGRVGTAEEAAAVALFLLSDDASYVTASQYPVDGGLTKR